MPARVHIVRLLSEWLRCCWYPNRRTTPRWLAGGDARGRWSRGLGSSTLVLALVAGMLTPAMSQAGGRSLQGVARPLAAHSAAHALVAAVATPTTLTPN